MIRHRASRTPHRLHTILQRPKRKMQMRMLSPRLKLPQMLRATRTVHRLNMTVLKQQSRQLTRTTTRNSQPRMQHSLHTMLLPTLRNARRLTRHCRMLRMLWMPL